MTNQVALEVDLGPRTLAAGELLVVTPWYPNASAPYSGGFVLQTVRALAPHFPGITVLHVENVPPDDVRPPRWSRTPEGPVLWIGVPMDPTTSRAEMMRLQGEALRAHALTLIRSATVVHCHVGAPTGAGLADLLAPTTRLVLTEHASYLPAVLGRADSREGYRRALERAEVVTAVGPGTAATIEAAFPGSLGRRVRIVPNPVPLHGFPLRPALPTGVSRWLSIGNLVPGKGLPRLLRCFAAWLEREPDPAARLTLVGQGVLRAELEELAERLGIADRLRLPGPVAPDEVAALHHEHDVLVHLSERETFGLVCVEAAASGLPVLATTSGGPQLTLSVPVALGLAQLVPVGDRDETADVVAAMSRLRSGLALATQGDVIASRVHLERCFGAPQIGRVLSAALQPGAAQPALLPAPAPVPPIARPRTSPESTESVSATKTTEPTGSVSASETTTEPTRPVRMLGLAVLATHARPTEKSWQQVALQGGGGVYLTTQPVSADLPPGIEVIDVSAIERRALISRFERAVVLRVPGTMLRLLARLAAVLDLLTRPLGARRPRVAPRVAGLQARHRAMAKRFRWGRYAAFWRLVGPWYVTRRLERDGVLDRLPLEDFDGLIGCDNDVLPLAVRLVRRRPELTITRRCTPESIARSYAARAGSGRGRRP